MALNGHGVNYLCHDEDSEAVYAYTKKKSPDLSVEALCWRYLSSRAVTSQVLSA